MQLIYDQLGRLLFRRRQRWQQRQHAKLLVHTVAFSLILGVIVAAVIYLMYNHRKP